MQKIHFSVSGSIIWCSVAKSSCQKALLSSWNNLCLRFNKTTEKCVLIRSVLRSGKRIQTQPTEVLNSRTNAHKPTQRHLLHNALNGTVGMMSIKFDKVRISGWTLMPSQHYANPNLSHQTTSETKWIYFQQWDETKTFPQVTPSHYILRECSLQLAGRRSQTERQQGDGLHVNFQNNDLD